MRRRNFLIVTLGVINLIGFACKSESDEIHEMEKSLLDISDKKMKEGEPAKSVEIIYVVNKLEVEKSFINTPPDKRSKADIEGIKELISSDQYNNSLKLYLTSSQYQRLRELRRINGYAE